LAISEVAMFEETKDEVAALREHVDRLGRHL